MTVQLYCGDCAIELEKFPDDCIDLTCTSPPYDNLRSYKGYTFDFPTIARQLYCVTKPGGVVVWVVGDATINGSETGTSFRQALYFMECGFNLHDTMIYNKNGCRYPDANRYYQVFEYMFVLSKGAPKTYLPIEDKKNAWAGDSVARKSQIRSADGKLTENSAWRNDRNKQIKEYGVRDNVWRLNPVREQDEGDHPAPFPEALARDHILSWSNPGDLVLDPFLGSGTTGKMAVLYERNFVGIEIAQEYLDIATKRIARVEQQPRLAGI